MQQRLFLILLVAVAGALPAIASADHEYRRNYNAAKYYADTATRQAQESRRLHCGYQGARWTENYNSHYRWASRHRRYEHEREVKVRKQALEQCRRYSRSHYGDRRYRGRRGQQRDYGDARDYRRSYSRHDNYPRRYAEIATKQARRNLRLSCGYRGGRWTTSYDNHYRWARKHSYERTKEEVYIRDSYLKECRRSY